MKYVVTLNGKDYEVEVSQGSAEVLSVSAAGTAAPAASAPAPVRAAAPAPATPAPATPAPATAAPAPSTAPTVGEGKTVTAPMPGTVLKLMVKTGDKVSNGQVLLVLEAMKMENEIFAPCDGTVTSVVVNTGASVNSGDVMITIG